MSEPCEPVSKCKICKHKSNWYDDPVIYDESDEHSEEARLLDHLRENAVRQMEADVEQSAVDQFNSDTWLLRRALDCSAVSNSLGLQTLSQSRSDSRNSIYMHLSSDCTEVTRCVAQILLQPEVIKKVMCTSEDHSTCDCGSPHFFMGNAATIHSDLAQGYHLQTVPTFLHLSSVGHEIGRLEGPIKPDDLKRWLFAMKERAASYAETDKKPFPKSSITRALTEDNGYSEMFSRLCRRSPFILIMKGTYHRPMCKFSRKFLEVLGGVPGLEYKCWNILEDASIRAYMTELTPNQVFPQLWFRGKFFGTLEKVTDMVESGKMEEIVTALRLEENDLKKRELQTILCSHKIVVLMYGPRDAPKDFFSRRVCFLFEQARVEFFHVDISEDPLLALKAVALFVNVGARDELNTIFPLVFSNGAYVGGRKSLYNSFASSGLKGVRDLLQIDPPSSEKKK